MSSQGSGSPSGRPHRGAASTPARPAARRLGSEVPARLLSKTNPRARARPGWGVRKHPRAPGEEEAFGAGLSARLPPAALRSLAEGPRQPSVPAAPRAKVSTDLTKMPSQMEHAMETMMFTFHKFAGDKGYLTKEDLRVLMEKEFPGFLENQKDPLAVDKIMKDLDQCRDGKVGFQSFFSLIAGLTIACNDYFVIHMKQKGKK